MEKEELQKVLDTVKTLYTINNNKADAQLNFIASRIKEHLIEFAMNDEHFASCIMKENKDFGECMVYVTNRAYKDFKESSDDACYQNARHYYLEDNILEAEYIVIHYKMGGGSSAPTKSNAKLDEKEKEKIKKEAIEEYKKSLKEAEQKKLEEKKARKEAKKQKELEEQKKKESVQMSLFDW